MSVNIVSVCRTALLGDLFTSRSKTGDVTLVFEDGAVSAHRQILSCLSHQLSCLLQPKTRPAVWSAHPRLHGMGECKVDTARQDTFQCLLSVLEIDKVTRYSSETWGHSMFPIETMTVVEEMDVTVEETVITVEESGEWSVVEGTSVSGLG